MSIGDNDTDLDYIKDIHHPSISPDGTRLAFSTLRHGDNYEIGVSNLDGSNYRRLTKTRYFEGNPVWSPDGTQIAFLSNRPIDEDADDDEYASPTALYTMNTDGTDVRRLASQVARIGLQAWSPDGRTLAFLVSEVPPSGRYKDIRYYIHTVRRDGSNLTRLAESISLPAWSPDGTTIAFLPDHLSIAAINPDGSELREIANIDPDSNRAAASVRTTYLAWSPDGSEILLQGRPFVLAKADGSGYGVFTGLHIDQAHLPPGLRTVRGLRLTCKNTIAPRMKRESVFSPWRRTDRTSVPC